MDPNDTSPITSTTYKLLRQSVNQEPRVLYAGPGDQFNVAGVATEFRNFEWKDLSPGSSIRVAVVYPTKKKQKIIPLQKVIKSYIDQKVREKEVEINIEEFYFKVNDTGARREQPLDQSKEDGKPMGFVYALERIYDILDSLLQKKFNRPVVQDFDRIIIPSLESDIFYGDEAKYDKPNVIFYECITRELVAGMGAGPGVQRDIFELAQALGRALFNDPQAVTYGKVLAALFPQLQIDHADWHGVVCHRHPDGKQRDRAYFIEELCRALHKELKGFFDKVFDL